MSDADEGGDATDREAIETRLDEVTELLEDAETEADLDEVDERLDEIEADVEAAALPEPEDEDDDPRAALEDRIEYLRDDVDAARGPYAADVVEEIEAVGEEITETEWTEAGEDELATVVESFLADVGETLVVDLQLGGSAPGDLTATLDEATAAVDGAELDPDADRETIAALVEAADALSAGVDDAESWDDLTVREKLEAQGFYDVLGHYKDYPPEWSAIKAYEQAGEVEPILLALDMLESNFMEEHCLDALKRLGDEKALEPMVERAEKRDFAAIEVLGKIGSDDPLEMLLDYVDTPKNPQLQKVTLKALGEIGSEEATGGVADQLVAENAEIRSAAARSLGLIGDTRAVEPLAAVLAEDDSDTVRASAAWALNQIGTARALEIAAEYAGDRAYLVQAEAEKAADAGRAV